MRRGLTVLPVLAVRMVPMAQQAAAAFSFPPPRARRVQGHLALAVLGDPWTADETFGRMSYPAYLFQVSGPIAPTPYGVWWWKFPVCVGWCLPLGVDFPTSGSPVRPRAVSEAH